MSIQVPAMAFFFYGVPLLAVIFAILAIFTAKRFREGICATGGEIVAFILSLLMFIASFVSTLIIWSNVYTEVTKP